MTAPVVGLSIRREAFEPAPPSYANMSIVGMAGPTVKAAGVTTEAFNAQFPLNTPVLFQSTGAVARMIDPDSTIGLALSQINSQMARMQTAAKVIFVRTETGVDDDATIANIRGNASAQTGIHAFKKAGPEVGYYPRLICIPGWTKQVKVGATGTDIVGGGTGYDSAPTLALPGEAGAGTGFAATAVLTAGVVTSVNITNPGAGYTPGEYALTVTGGTPDTAATINVTIGMLANPIVAELGGVLSSFLGIAVINGEGDNRDEDVDFRETVQSERIQVVTSTVNVANSTGATVEVDLAPSVIGLYVRRDFEFEGRPFRSVMNQPVYGILGPTRNIGFSITDGATEGQDLLAHQVGPVIRGESGDDFAIADGGFVFMGFEGTGEELVWRQIHKVRGRDFIELTVIRTLRTYFGRFNLNVQTIQAIVNTVDNVLSIAEGKQEILGYQCRFDPEENNADDLRTGHIYIDARFEECPVFRRATILSRPHRPALDATIESLLASSALA
jgi:phage tail sheath protein FI